MKRRLFATILLLVFVLSFVLTACSSNQPAPTDPPEAEPETTVQEMNTPVTDAPETDAPEYVIRRAPEEIEVYPFNAGELSAALRVVDEKLKEFAAEEGVLTYDVERVAFDPIMTDVRCRQYISDAPTDGWTESDYHERYICFTVTYSATYDHQKTFMQDTEHCGISVTLYREDAQSEWAYSEHGSPIEEHSQEALSAEECKQLTADGRILAAYQVGEDECWLYVCDDEAGTVHFVP